jgi:hypothetical protein
MLVLGDIRRIPLDSVPIDTDEHCAEWLHKHFKEKVNIACFNKISAHNKISARVVYEI